MVGMVYELASSAASVLSAELPDVIAEVMKVPGTRRYVIFATIKRGNKRKDIVIKDAMELALILASIELQSGRDLSSSIRIEQEMSYEPWVESISA